MTQRTHRSLVASVCALACVAGTVATLWTASGPIRTADRNGDGRPDVWRTYTRQGQLARVDVDTNFDGRADVHEYYERGLLIRRESDRDFNDRVDLVQEFDPATREQVRSVVDVDFDGRADLLVLFRGGLPVFSTWAHPPRPALLPGVGLEVSGSGSRGASQPAPLEDPFRDDIALRAIDVLASGGDGVGLPTSSGLPESGRGAAGPPVCSSAVAIVRVCTTASAPIVPHAPRGPPTFLLLA